MGLDPLSLLFSHFRQVPREQRSATVLSRTTYLTNVADRAKNLPRNDLSAHLLGWHYGTLSAEDQPDHDRKCESSGKTCHPRPQPHPSPYRTKLPMPMTMKVCPGHPSPLRSQEFATQNLWLGNFTAQRGWLNSCPRPKPCTQPIAPSQSPSCYGAASPNCHRF